MSLVVGKAGRALGFVVVVASLAATARADEPNPAARGWVLAPFVGTNVLLAGDLGDGSLDGGMGFRLGGLVGRKVATHWSLGGQATLDLFNLRAPIATDAYLLRADLAPLFHWAGVDGELLAGPLLGGWRYAADSAPAGSSLVRHQVMTNGFSYGAHAGALVRLPGGRAGGVLVSWVNHRGLDLCQTLAYAGFGCNPDAARSLDVLGVTLVLSL